MFGLGPQELVLILLILLLLFGASRIPQIAKSLGKASREFKEANAGTEETAKKKRKEAKAKS